MMFRPGSSPAYIAGLAVEYFGPLTDQQRIEVLHWRAKRRWPGLSGDIVHWQSKLRDEATGVSFSLSRDDFEDVSKFPRQVDGVIATLSDSNWEWSANESALAMQPGCSAGTPTLR